MLAVGERYLVNLSDRERRAASAFAGGVGHTLQDQCGAYSAGVMIIGALLGRIRADEEDQLSRDTIRVFRERFLRRMGSVMCGELRANGYDSENGLPCSSLVSDAVAELVAVLDEGD